MVEKGMRAVSNKVVTRAIAACIMFCFNYLASAAEAPQLFRFANTESIPPLITPQFVNSAKAEAFLKPEEPVLGVFLGGEARAYSVWQLERHLVVDDAFGGRAVAITWCPFSHTAAVYARTLGDRDLTFEADGRLLNDEIVLRDRETGSVWTQAEGKAISGPSAGSRRLTALPVLQTTWKVWKQEQPGTLALVKSGADSEITSSAYADYDADPAKVGLGHTGVREAIYGGKALMVGIVSGDEHVAISLEKLKEQNVVDVLVDHQAMAAIYDPASKTVRVVRREARGRDLLLARAAPALFGPGTPPHLVDEQTGSSWDFTGRALAGPMQGHQLPLVPYRVQYWYAWQAYFPHSRLE